MREATTFPSIAELGAAIARARDDVRAWQAAIADSGPSWWAASLDERIAQMKRSRDATLRYLRDIEPQIRLAASALVASYWPPWSGFASELMRLAFADTQPSIRGAALCALLLLRHDVADPAGRMEEFFAAVFPISQAEAGDIDRFVRESQASQSAFLNALLSQLAGPDLPQILQSRMAAESCLQSEDPQLRSAAIVALTKHWRVNEDFIPTCESLLFHDPSLKVRLQALAALASYYIGTDDRRTGELLAGFVQDGSIPRELRRAAYESLFSLRGMPVTEFLAAASPRFRFPEEVDWAFVDTFVGPSG